MAECMLREVTILVIGYMESKWISVRVRQHTVSGNKPYSATISRIKEERRRSETCSHEADACEMREAM